ncbi:MAG TPA: hypothetical protein VLJ13_00565, partial [Brevundimonas sp.]|nr:hypothetical protein [Brevundimonas sp.]
MRTAGGLLLVCAALSGSGAAEAGPWTQPEGRAQVILKFEEMRADRGFGPEGALVGLPARRRDSAVGLFAEYGLSERVTLQFKGDWQSGEDAFVNYEARGPLEIGATWQVWRDDRTALSLYGGYADGGEGRNAGYAPPGQGQHDWEIRASAGRSFGGAGGRVGHSSSFVDLQAARRMREGLPDETRLEATAGARFANQWMILAQAYGGQADDGEPRWLAVETSIVRDLGSWSLQAGWRRAVSGRETP